MRPDTGLFHCGSRKLLWWLGVAACQNKTAKASDKGKMGWGEGRPVFLTLTLSLSWALSGVLYCLKVPHLYFWVLVS